MIRKLCLGLLGCLISTMIMAMPTTPQPLAAQVMAIRTPIVDKQALKKDATEVFMELINRGNQPHTIIGAYSPAAHQVQLHTTLKRPNGTTYMQQINGITIQPHHDKDLHMGGLHVMLMRIDEKLILNHRIPIVLMFHDGSWIKINARVS